MWAIYNEKWYYYKQRTYIPLNISFVFHKQYDENWYTSQEDVIELNEKDDYIFNLEMRQHANDVLQYILTNVWLQ